MYDFYIGMPIFGAARFSPAESRYIEQAQGLSSGVNLG